MSPRPAEEAPGRSWRRKARSLPADDPHCGWLAGLPDLPPARRLAAEVRVPAAVIGAGFTGLAAARRLAELAPGEPVALVEGQRVGQGAAGRSSGFVVDQAHFVARMAPADGERYAYLARGGIEALRRRVDEDGIACDWDPRGWLHVAAGQRAAAELAGLEAWLAGRGTDFERLDGDALRQVTGVSYYRAGLRLPGSVLVQPAKLVRGLAASLPSAVTLYEESPVRAVERRDGRFHLLAGDGVVVADRLLLATNGATPALGFLGRRVVPLFTFGSLTRRLTRDEQDALGGESEWGLLAEDAMGSTVRRTRDQRILVRNAVRYSERLAVDDEARRRAGEWHRRAFRARFPMLPEVRFEHSWAGLLGVTPQRDTFFGELEPGLYAAAGYTGAGIAFGTAVGALLAEHALGRQSEELAAVQALPAPRRLPPQPLLGAGARLRAWRMNRSAAPDA